MDESEQAVRKVLEPTEDLAGWYQMVDALDRTACVPVLIRMLEDAAESTWTRKQAGIILGILGAAEAVAAFKRLINHDDALLRGTAAEALGQINVGDDEVVAVLIGGLRDEDYFVREVSAKALGHLKAPGALGALEHMKDTDSVPANREVAQVAIRSIEGED